MADWSTSLTERVRTVTGKAPDIDLFLHIHAHKRVCLHKRICHIYEKERGREERNKRRKGAMVNDILPMPLGYIDESDTVLLLGDKAYPCS